MDHKEQLLRNNPSLDFDYSEGQTNIDEEFVVEETTYKLTGSITLKHHYMGDHEGESIYEDSYTWHDLKLERLDSIGDPILVSDSAKEIEKLVY